MTPRRLNWKALRVAVQCLAFAAVVVYFLALVWPFKAAWRPDLLFQLDPLMHLYLLLSGAGVSSWLMLALALVLLFAVSRIFCGWLCPLGAMLDFFSGVRGRLTLLNGHRPPAPSAANSSIRLPAYFDVYLLLFFAVVSLFRNPLVWLLDPVVFSFKFLTVTLLPVVDQPVRSVYSWADNLVYQQKWWWPVQDAYNSLFVLDRPPHYVDTTLILLFAALILGLEFKQKRFWCRYICPLGALLRLTYRLHPLRRRIKPDCTYCLKCEVGCHFGGTAEADCIYCMECITDCPQGAISFLPRPEPPATLPQARLQSRTAGQDTGDEGTKAAMRERVAGTLPPARISRRLALQYAGGAFVAVPLLRLFDNRHELPADFIRPPGVEDERKFTELCIKCGECLKACTTNGLQPALTEAGLSGLWTPHLVSRIGYCEYECNLCGQVCPSQAIPKMVLADKQQFLMGIAYFDRDCCIPFVTVNNCTVCEEHCPTPDKAIKFRAEWVEDETGTGHEVLQPYVVPKLCIGCGICEHVCPVPQIAAVRVFRRPVGAAYEAGALPLTTFDSNPASAGDNEPNPDDPYGLGM